jgi:hypothetical protein
MGVRSVMAVLVASAGLVACSTYPADWTPEQIAAYEQSNAQQQARSQQMVNQAIVMTQGVTQPAPQVQPVTPANNTITVYCNQLGTYTTTCRTP